MSAKEYSMRIETLLHKVNNSLYRKSDEILLNPYTEIISSLEGRIQQKSLDNFKLYYQAIEGKSLQELVDEEYYDMEQLIKDLKQIIDKNNY